MPLRSRLTPETSRMVQEFLALNRRLRDSRDGERQPAMGLHRNPGSPIESGIHRRPKHDQANPRREWHRSRRPAVDELRRTGSIECRERLGGLLRYYRRAA